MEGFDIKYNVSTAGYIGCLRAISLEWSSVQRCCRAAGKGAATLLCTIRQHRLLEITAPCTATASFIFTWQTMFHTFYCCSQRLAIGVVVGSKLFSLDLLKNKTIISIMCQSRVNLFLLQKNCRGIKSKHLYINCKNNCLLPS